MNSRVYKKYYICWLKLWLLEAVRGSNHGLLRLQGKTILSILYVQSVPFSHPLFKCRDTPLGAPRTVHTHVNPRTPENPRVQCISSQFQNN